MKLAITQIALGVLSSVVAVLLRFWYLPTYLYPLKTVSQEGDLTRVTYVMYRPEVGVVYQGLVVISILGLAVLGCGIAQLLKVKHELDTQGWRL